MISELIRSGRTPQLYWAVPISGTPRKIAHLLLVRHKGAVTERLCNQSVIVNRHHATVVPAGYDPRCAKCFAILRSLGSRVVVIITYTGAGK